MLRVAGVGLSGALQPADQPGGGAALHQRPGRVSRPVAGQPVRPGHPALSQDARHLQRPPLRVCKFRSEEIIHLFE